MSNDHEVSTAQLRSASGRLNAITERLSESIQGFRSKVEGFGEPWGGDDIGMLIGMAHGAVFNAAMESFSSSAGELGIRSSQLLDAADTHDRAEESSTAGVNRISELLNGPATPR
ncbi:WXG100 family type VII secretion target [Actinomadura adrarensis]|uniref:WXG100 family type VII secretion target n=1 Tax=Actinomadura adrarensis TaxID=1819600 RepID=A0ABW3CEU0_9ACTN